MLLMQRQVSAESGAGERESGVGGRLASTVRERLPFIEGNAAGEGGVRKVSEAEGDGERGRRGHN
jgi:hypothetical protein